METDGRPENLKSLGVRIPGRLMQRLSSKSSAPLIELSHHEPQPTRTGRIDGVPPESVNVTTVLPVHAGLEDKTVDRPATLLILTGTDCLSVVACSFSDRVSASNKHLAPAAS